MESSSRTLSKSALHIAGAVSFVSYISLALSNQNSEATLHLLTFYTLLAIPLLALVLLIFRFWPDGAQHPRLRVILLWAILFRGAGVFALPVYEDDYFRFLWDGYVFSSQGSPYGSPPQDFYFSDSLSQAHQDVLWEINYPELPTIYGPVIEVVFLISHWLAPMNLSVLKVLFVVFECLMLGLLAPLVSRKILLALSWLPLLVFETSFQAHPDIIGITFLTAATFCHLRRKPLLAMIFLGLAFSVKIFALLAFPFFLKRQLWWQGSAIFTLTVITSYAYFFLYAGDLGTTSLGAMAIDWEYNSGPYALLATLVHPVYARLTCLGIFAIAYGIIIVKYWLSGHQGKSPPLPLAAIYGLFFFLSPVINPWYLLWLAPFMALHPAGWAWVASIVVLLSYLRGETLGWEGLADFDVPLIVRLIEFGAVTLALTRYTNGQKESLSKHTVREAHTD